MLAPSGIHHVTAISSDAQRTLDFYSGVLGLRLIKRTVNFDDPTTYHLYFGDTQGHRGTVLTFFPWPNAYRGRPGAGFAAVIGLAIAPSAVGFWIDRLLKHQIPFDPPTTRYDERVIAFRDPDGLLLELVAHPSIDGWAEGESVAGVELGYAVHPAPSQTIRGIYAVTLWEEGLTGTATTLTEQLGFHLIREQGSIYRYALPESRAGAMVDVRVVPGLWSGTLGAGTIHHVAFRAATDVEQVTLRETLAKSGVNITPQLDRDYFRSVYFREPGGVLFEVATDGPGFTVDEPADQLGRSLKLPAWLEPRRFEIEALLPNMHLPIDLPGPNA